ncbi:MlaE family ABC transporter permease [Jiella pelagia]|uniref:ABC transporter permease n=1 Tax=Jiella pelagia TaxID=2986949 RepID=A0ABY7C0D1_9HYPH|nr:ABC transporter permease [Jiella pelagia]WAP68805.1 ABC transporter permease [Jiella pelagia]
MSKRDEALFEAVRGAMDKDVPAAEKTRPNPLIAFPNAVGSGVYAVRDELVAALNVLGGAIYGAGNRLTGRTRGRPAAVFNQLDQMGVKAIPIIVLITFLIGGIIAQQGAFQLRRFGGEVYAVNLVGILVLREIGVLLAAIMIAGRSGSAITAEIGSMKMREEIDALHVIGLNPISVLVFPRLLALTIALPLLTVLANLAALLGGMLTLKLYSDISFANFLQGIQTSVDLFTVFSGVIKAPFMAIVIGVVGALEGMKVGGSAESLGLRVTASVVKSIFLVIVMDGLFAIFYASMGL